MNHARKARKFGRVRRVRNALVRSLALSLIMKGKIKTTEAKAKEIRPYVEKLISHSRENTITTKRLLSAKIGDAGTRKLVEVVGPKYKNRNGGYLRIIKIQNRKTDGSKMAQIELV